MSFQNPVGLAAAQRHNTAAMGAWADEIWDSICYLGCTGESFHTIQIADLVARDAKGAITYDTARRYVLAFIAYAAAVPDEFAGAKSRLTRIRRGWYRLTDNPE